ncbi:MAG: plasmid pRiA4b ORF-3 family protein [Thermoplasmata archaeon]
MARSNRYGKDRQIIIFTDTDIPEETDFMKISNSAGILLNMITSAHDDEQDNEISKLKPLMGDRLNGRIRELSDRFEASPLKKKDLMFWMSTIFQYIVNAHYSGSDRDITEMLQIISSSDHTLPGNPEKEVLEEQFTEEEFDLGDIIAVKRNRRSDPFEKMLKNGETLVKKYRNYSLAIEIVPNPESSKTYSVLVYLDADSNKVFAATIFGSITINKNTVLTMSRNRFRSKLLKDFVLHIYEGDAESVTPYRMKDGMPDIPEKRNVKKPKAASSRKDYADEKERAITFKVSIEGISPPIWRRIVVRDDATLEDLHLMIQAAMGWENYHLHEFEIRGTSYSPPNEEDDAFEDRSEDSTGIKLCDLNLAKGTRFHYTYDFGDDWEHNITVEKIEDADPDTEYPMCVSGKRRAPREDCGGVPGYYDLLEILADPKHPDHSYMKKWAGKGYDPERFSVDDCNREIRNYQSLDLGFYEKKKGKGSV